MKSIFLLRSIRSEKRRLLNRYFKRNQSKNWVRSILNRKLRSRKSQRKNERQKIGRTAKDFHRILSLKKSKRKKKNHAIAKESRVFSPQSTSRKNSSWTFLSRCSQFRWIWLKCRLRNMLRINRSSNLLKSFSK